MSPAYRGGVLDWLRHRVPRLDSVRYQRYQGTMSDEEEFTRPAAPAAVRPAPPHHDVVFFRRETAGGAGTKEFEDIMLRRVPRETAMQFRGSAGGRGLTHAQYLKALVELHARIRERADEGNESTRRLLLDELGLASVTV